VNQCLTEIGREYNQQIEDMTQELIAWCKGHSWTRVPTDKRYDDCPVIGSGLTASQVDGAAMHANRILSEKAT
jgi:hypothetical protein